MPLGTRKFSHLHSVLTSSVVPSHPLFDQYYVSCLGWSRQGIATHLHLVLRLKMSGAVPLPSLCPLMAWTGLNYFFYIMYDCNLKPHVLRCMYECGNVFWVNSDTSAELDDPELKENVTTSSHIVWTAALDRQLVACCLETGQVMADIPTLGGCVYCIAISPLDSMR